MAELLSEVIWKRRPELIGVLGTLQDIKVTEDQREDRQAPSDPHLQQARRNQPSGGSPPGRRARAAAQ